MKVEIVLPKGMANEGSIKIDGHECNQGVHAFRLEGAVGKVTELHIDIFCRGGNTVLAENAEIFVNAIPLRTGECLALYEKLRQLFQPDYSWHKTSDSLPTAEDDGKDFALIDKSGRTAIGYWDSRTAEDNGQVWRQITGKEYGKTIGVSGKESSIFHAAAGGLSVTLWCRLPENVPEGKK